LWAFESHETHVETINCARDPYRQRRDVETSADLCGHGGPAQRCRTLGLRSAGDFSTGKISEAVTNPAFRGFFPDLFVAGFTGVVVGAILNFIQKHRLRQEMQYDGELARLMLLDRLNVFTFAPSLDDLGHLGTID
jgi:hypothetical protein